MTQVEQSSDARSFYLAQRGGDCGDKGLGVFGRGLVIQSRVRTCSAIVTIANYLEGLIFLGKVGSVNAEARDGMRYMRAALRDEARLGEKLKIARINNLMRKGGFECIAEVIGDLLAEADLLPDHSACKELPCRELISGVRKEIQQSDFA